MIKKIVLVFAILLTISGCQSDTAAFERNLNKMIKYACDVDIVAPEENNCIKEYYNYYLSKEIGRSYSNLTSNGFIIQGNECSLALDASGILEKYILADKSQYVLRDIGQVANNFYKNSGLYKNSSGEEMPYKVIIDKLEDGTYFVLIQTSQFIFIGNIKNGSCENTVYDMMILLRSIVVDEKSVILNFASESVIEYETNIITLFDDVLPESGYIIDYIDSWRDDTSFIIINNKERPKDENQQ